MVARVLIPGLLIVTAVMLVFWLAPLNLVLSLRGYSSQEITRMQAANEPQPDVACPQDRRNPAPQETSEFDAGAKSPSRSPEPPTTAQNKPEPAAAPEPPPARKIVATATVNVRAGAGTNFRVVGQFKPDETVTVVEDPAGDWLKVKGDSVTGWVYRPLFDKK